MARFASTACLVVFATLSISVEGFAPTAFGISKSSTTSLSAELSRRDVRFSIKSLTAENFSETLTIIEPFLTKEAGISTYTKSMKRISNKAKEVGAKIPEGFAKEAKATEKRRTKQDEFIKGKEEERLSAEAAAAAEAAEAAEAEAAAEAEKASAEEEEAVKEPELVEA